MRAQAKTGGHFNLAAFSFLLCFGLLLWNWWDGINGAADLLLTVGCAAFISLFGSMLIALLIRLAVFLPIRVASNLDSLAAACYLACLGILMSSWWRPGEGVFDTLCTMAVTAILALPCSLVLILPARIIARFFRDLYPKENNTLALVKRELKGTQETQLWVRGVAGGFYYEVRAAYRVQDKLLRSCVLETGKVGSKKDALADGAVAFDRLKN